jgi:hypothetical protein
MVVLAAAVAAHRVRRLEVLAAAVAQLRGMKAVQRELLGKDMRAAILMAQLVISHRVVEVALAL